MLQAEQEALIQEANQQIVAIRGEELRYYVYIFSQYVKDKSSRWILTAS